MVDVKHTRVYEISAFDRLQRRRRLWPTDRRLQTTHRCSRPPSLLSGGGEDTFAISVEEEIGGARRESVGTGGGGRGGSRRGAARRTQRTARTAHRTIQSNGDQRTLFDLTIIPASTFGAFAIGVSLNT